MITRDDPAPPRRLPLAGAPPDLVPARMINEALYCERLLYLEWAQGEFDDNVFTVDGRAVHRRADHPGGALPPRAAGVAEPGEPSPEPLPYEARSVWLSSERLGITAKIDIVEGDAAGHVVPIEYKRGDPPDLPEGAYLPERAQLCAQVLLLREHGHPCDSAEIYFAAARRRVPIAIDDELIAATLAAAARAREVVVHPELPPPLVDSPKCKGCSLVGICLPDETNLLRRLAGEPLDSPSDATPPPSPPAIEADLDGPLADDPWGLAPPAVEDDDDALPRVRRLHPARDDKIPLYVQEQGARVSLSGDRLVVTSRTGVRSDARLPNTSQVALFGSVQITTQALRALLERDIPLTFFTYGGYFMGRAVGLDSKNVEVRVAQHRATRDDHLCLTLARGFVTTKIKNARTLLRRNHESPSPVALSELDQLARKAAAAPSLDTLLGLEGTAARVYFAQFSGMLKGPPEVRATFDLDGRNRRPPRDPINALLSFAYALLAKDLSVTLTIVGLDPLLGFYHQPRFGRPALALDLMEELRPIVADSVVLTAVNTGVITPDDFVSAAGSVALRPSGRKSFLLAYERRMDQLITHPLFGYRISYRRLLEVQARLLSRVLLGEIDAYPSFRTR